MFSDCGPLLQHILLPDQSIYLRRGAAIILDGDIEILSQVLPKTSGFIVNRLSGIVYRVSQWTNKSQNEANITADRQYFGRVMSIPLTPETLIHMNFSHYLGHTGDLTFHATRMAKKELWYLTCISGDGTLFVKIPGGYTHLTPPSTLRIDRHHISVIRGDISGVGRGLGDIKDLVQSGEMGFVDVTGDFELILQQDTRSAGGGSGLMSIFENFV